MAPLGPVLLETPSRIPVAGYRDSLASDFGFVVKDYDGSVTVDLPEGSGTTTRYFSATRLCGQSEPITNETWRPLRESEPLPLDIAGCQELLRWADDQEPKSMWGKLRVLRARTFALRYDLPSFLEQEVPRLLAGMPNASLWFISVDDLLTRRLSFVRAQLALTLTPDIRLGTPEFEGFTLLQAHSLTSGTDFGGALALPLLAFSPGVTGVPLSWPPHTLVLLFGQTIDLEKPDYDAPSGVFRPRTFGRPGDWNDPPFWQDLKPAEVEPLVPWWVERLNVLYSHAADPTQFADSLGRHDAGAQAAWYLTLERMLVDATLMLAEPAAADITRMQLAFDILDKSEGLLGYQKSGPGFKDLLRRSKTLPRLQQAWSRLPDGSRQRFLNHSVVTFDSLYADIRQHTLKHRQTKNGMLVAEDDRTELKPVGMDEYVGCLLREIRNSAHGLKRLLRGTEKYLLATHAGDVPSQLADLSGLIVFALVADAEKLCDGTWW